MHSIDLELVATDAGEMWFPMCDEVMRDFIRNSGTWEPSVGRALLEAMPSRAGAVFVDVGANVGYFSLLVANAFPLAIVQAFEPHPLTFQVLRMNTWLLGDRVCAWPVALSDANGTVALSTTLHNLGDTKGVPGSSGMRASTVAPSMRLDDLIGDMSVDLVKIDVQGAELAVLSGMRGVIDRSPGVRIVMEFSPGLLQKNGVDAMAVLSELRSGGFNLSLVCPDALFAASDAEILRYCQSAGVMGQANLLLSRTI
ncbi:FkbM family methyltransferase [Rhodanobacter denitrificans]|uniref:Methyltransferase, FkbM family n=1 Tax=Rhodanobacter denitrificans TaxID=666685 RepID=M4NAX7_9GAMM|nr:FkbM family methyltransferase [Rhodanobacter denitrificans]AGG87745.1 methyltransferase, FkbM family [Rhodanobacter denitrificans]UJM86912.1 FkbM family methyltransferase [Rhodanobacter denitrificans]